MQTKVILQRGMKGQLVRKLFQPKGLSTDMQKETRTYSATAKDLATSPKLIRLHTDASRLCAIMKIWVGYVHSALKMDNTVFPPAHSTEVLELLIATKFPQWIYLKRPLFSVTSRGQLGWPPPIKEEGPYQVARTGLHGKLERFVLQVDRGAVATQGSTDAQSYNKCNNAENLLKYCPIWALNSYWVG